MRIGNLICFDAQGPTALPWATFTAPCRGHLFACLVRGSRHVSGSYRVLRWRGAPPIRGEGSLPRAAVYLGDSCCGVDMHVDLRGPGAGAAYRLLTNVVIPRPIAWVCSMDVQGGINLAPFSFFNVMG